MVVLVLVVVLVTITFYLTMLVVNVRFGSNCACGWDVRNVVVVGVVGLG